MIKKTLILIIPCVAAILLGLWIYVVKQGTNNYQTSAINHQTEQESKSSREALTSISKIQSPTSTPTMSPTPTPTEFMPQSVLLEVPFAPQAPFADWKDPRQQDGCEEAAVILAIKWAKGENITYQQMLDLILDMAKYQVEKYGENRDTSASDTLERLIKGYFNYDQAFLKQVNRYQDIVNELMKENVVIIPMNGQALNNPHFTAPGPERHNLVVKGYDAKTEEFITNDVGIKEGNSYRYPASVFMSAIRDYPTGYHIPIKEFKKVMIVVEKVS